MRNNCDTPFCCHHGQYGHATEGCSAERAKKSKRSYASVAAVLNVPLMEVEGTGQTVLDEDNETDDIDGTAGIAKTGLRNDGMRQTASAEPGSPLPQRAAGLLKRGEPPERDGHAHPAQTPAAAPTTGGTAGNGKQRTTTTSTTSTTLNIDDNVTTDRPPPRPASHSSHTIVLSAEWANLGGFLPPPVPGPLTTPLERP